MERKQFTLEELAKYTQTQLIGNPHHIIKGIETLENATQSDASFLANPRYEQAMRSSCAGVVFTSPDISLPIDRNFLVGDAPSQAFQMAAEAILSGNTSISGFPEIHPTAVVHHTAKIAEGVKLGPYVVIDENVTIGGDTVILAHTYVGPRTQIGENCLFHARVTIREDSQIGNKVILQPGVVIGSCGFGYTTNAQGKHSKLSQLGRVCIGDEVEIGANSTIDRARLKDTLIKRGTKIDNLVQIAHGATIGEDNLIVAQTGVAGSSETGERVVLAGQVGVAGHLKICSDVMIGARAAVAKSITKPGKYSGHPLQPIDLHQRNHVLLRNLNTFVDRLKKLEANFHSLKA